MRNLFAACLLTLTFQAHSQFYFFNERWYESDFCWEAGVSTGGMNCLTDLGGKSGTGRSFIKDVNWQSTRHSGSIYTVLTYRDLLAARLQWFFGEVTAADSILENDGSAAYGRYLRNLHFRSDIIESALLLEFHPLQLGSQWNEKVSAVISPYVLTGIGHFSFNPQAKVNNAWVNLPELHTEGQGMAAYPHRKPYRLRQVNVPLGLGIRYQAGPVLSARFEILYRKLWTDYLDDVSTTYIEPGHFTQHFNQPVARLASKLADRRRFEPSGVMPEPGAIRGNPENNDTYFSFMLKVSVTLGRQKHG
jgi:hypothetical protein